jgi:hypothetical protein
VREIRDAGLPYLQESLMGAEVTESLSGCTANHEVITEHEIMTRGDPSVTLAPMRLS